MPLDAPTITADFSAIGQQAGITDWSVTRQWASRPPDQRFISRESLLAMLDERTAKSNEGNIRLGDIIPRVDDMGELALEFDGNLHTPTNYSFMQYCQHLDVPTHFLTHRLSAAPELVAACLEHGLRTADNTSQEVMAYTSRADLRALTGPNYGRILDRDFVRAVSRVLDESGVEWRVPTAYRSADGKYFGQQYDCVDPTTESTTLYASDRDVYLFLVDEHHPIEAGKLPNGDPDLYFRGIIGWNGECGGVSNGIATMLYRAVCLNRSIREQKGFERISISHTKNASEIFMKRLIPALKTFAEGSTIGIVSGMDNARRQRVARTDDERMHFLTHTLNFGFMEAQRIMGRAIAEEQRPIETAYDAVQAITAWARSLPNQDHRVSVERRAGKLLAAASA